MIQRHRIRPSFILLPLLLAVLAFGLIAFLQPAPAQAPVAPAAHDDAATAFQRENDVAMERMMTDMHVPATGDVDRDFTRMMIPHHQGAIDMAQALLRHGSNPELKALARAIIAKQEEEIATMRRIGGEPAPGASPAPPHHHHMQK